MFLSLRKVRAMQYAHALEVAVNAVHVTGELRRVTEHDRPWARKVDLDVVDALAPDSGFPTES